MATFSFSSAFSCCFRCVSASYSYNLFLESSASLRYLSICQWMTTKRSTWSLLNNYCTESSRSNACSLIFRDCLYIQGRRANIESERCRTCTPLPQGAGPSFFYSQYSLFRTRYLSFTSHHLIQSYSRLIELKPASKITRVDESCWSPTPPSPTLCTLTYSTLPSHYAPSNTPSTIYSHPLVFTSL